MTIKFLIANLKLEIDGDTYQIRQYIEIGDFSTFCVEIYKQREDYDDEEDNEDDGFEKILQENIEDSDVKSAIRTIVGLLNKIKYKSNEIDFLMQLTNKDWIIENIDYFKDIIYTNEYIYNSQIAKEICEKCSNCEVSICSYEKIDFISIKDYFELDNLENISYGYLESKALENIREEIEYKIPRNWFKLQEDKFCLEPSNTETCFYIENIRDFIDGLEDNYVYIVENDNDLDDFRVLMYKLNMERSNSNYVVINSDLNNRDSNAIIFVDLDEKDDLVTRLKSYKKFRETTGCETLFISRNSDDFEILRVTLP